MKSVFNLWFGGCFGGVLVWCLGGCFGGMCEISWEGFRALKHKKSIVDKNVDQIMPDVLFEICSIGLHRKVSKTRSACSDVSPDF